VRVEPETKRLDPEIESTLYRLIQESLTNVIKHAEAGQVRVELVEAAGWVNVSVVDDGTGFDTAQISPGFGLVGMQDRVGLVGGRVSVESAPGTGATVRVAVPARYRDGDETEPRAPAPASPEVDTLAG